jgi:ATP-binding cassette subfamily B protein
VSNVSIAARSAPDHQRQGVGSMSLRLMRYALRRWPGLLALLGIMLLNVGLELLKPWPMKLLIDNVLGGKPLPAWASDTLQTLDIDASQNSLLAWSVAGTVVIFLLGWVAALASAYAGIGFGQRVAYDLAADLFAHLERLSLRFHSHRSTGDTILRVTTDSACVSTITRDALLPALSAMLSLVAMFLIMWQLDWQLTLLAVAVVPFMVVAFRRYAGPMLDRSYHRQEAEGQIYNVVEQTLSSIPVVQTFAYEERMDRRFTESTRATLDATLSLTAVQLRFKVWTGLATALGSACILWVGAEHVLSGSLSVGSILVFLSYLNALYAPLQSIAYTSSTLQDAAGSARRVLEILDTKPDVRDRVGARALPRARGHVRIEHVTFGYEEGRPVLSDASLEALPGQTIAIVGPTGAGKSTLVSLIPRLFDPWSGSVSIDGYSIKNVRLQSVRKQVGLVLQEPFLFPMSIAENIAYGRPEASIGEVKAAARAASAHEFIMNLAEGYDTVVGEWGATLSGGERQRIAIARALLKDAPILVLDEPTSALDAHTEELLMGALETLKSGRTTFIIAHRLSTIRDADLIVVMDHGTIVEVGSHLELLEHGTHYRRLHDAQFHEPAQHLTGSAL